MVVGCSDISISYQTMAAISGVTESSFIIMEDVMPLFNFKVTI